MNDAPDTVPERKAHRAANATPLAALGLLLVLTAVAIWGVPSGGGVGVAAVVIALSLFLVRPFNAPSDET